MRRIVTLLICLIFSSASIALESYVVQQNDSLASILKSKNYGATYQQVRPFVNEIIQLNPDVFSTQSPDRIIPGTTIQLPENPNQPGSKTISEPEPNPEPVVTSVAKAEPALEPVIEPAPEPVLESSLEPALEPVTETEALAELAPAIEPEALPEVEVVSETASSVEPEPLATAEPESPPKSIIGSISIEKGEIDILREGQLMNVNKQQSLLVDDTIISKQNAIAIIQLNDQTTFKLGPESSLTINQFSYSDDQADPTKPRGSLLATISGGFVRTITGLLAKLNSNDYEIFSSLSIAIGIRGTDFTVRDCSDEAQCGDLYGVSVAVRDGTISFKNEGGEIELNQNEFSLIQSATETPLAAAIPENFFDVEVGMSEIIVEKSFWQKIVAWFNSLF